MSNQVRTSSVREPKNDKILVIKRWQIEFCGGNKIAASVMSYLQYWHDVAIGLIRRGERTDAWQWHSAEEIQDGVMIWSTRSISEAVGYLEDKGVIKTGVNPRNPLDRTKFFLFDPEVCNAFLDTYDAESADSILQNEGLHSANLQGGGGKFSTCIALTTPKNTTESTFARIRANSQAPVIANAEPDTRILLLESERTEEDPSSAQAMPTKAIQPQAENFGWLQSICIGNYAPGRIGKAASALTKAAADSDQRRHFETWWRTADWRGAKGQSPTPEQVWAMWPVAAAWNGHIRTGSAENNQIMDRYAAAFAKAAAEDAAAIEQGVKS